MDIAVSPRFATEVRRRSVHSGRDVFAFLAALVLSTTALGIRSTRASGSDAPQRAPRAAIVLVHGAFADGSGWNKVIPILERDGYFVIAVQNPLNSTPDDIANTRRVIDDQTLPVVLV